MTNEALQSYGNAISHHARVTSDENIEVLVAENGVYSGLTSEEAVDTLCTFFAGINGETLLEINYS